jgi:hypothetical protein
MNDWHDEVRYRRNVITIPVITIPVIWLAFVLSLMVHVTALWEWLPRLPLLARDALAPSDAASPMTVQLASPENTPESSASAKIADAQSAKPSPPPRTPPPKPPRRTLPTPPVIALTPPSSTLPVPPPAQPREIAPSPPTPPPAPPIEGDLSAYISARRRARGEAEPASSNGAAANSPAEDDIARRDRIVASNLASVNSQNFGNSPKNSGGIFQITRMGYSDAEFAFFGWNKDIRRRATQKIEVRLGDNGDIRHAVIRKMIAIIREYETEDFVWESHRLTRNITLSARLRDNAELEAFMMREFFDEPGLPR